MDNFVAIDVETANGEPSVPSKLLAAPSPTRSTPSSAPRPTTISAASPKRSTAYRAPTPIRRPASSKCGRSCATSSAISPWWPTTRPSTVAASAPLPATTASNGLTIPSSAPSPHRATSYPAPSSPHIHCLTLPSSSASLSLTITTLWPTPKPAPPYRRFGTPARLLRFIRLHRNPRR